MNPDHKLKEQTFKLISWPSPQDYQEAIQAPLLNVDDQELQSGVVEQNALGLPRPRTGFFATVYKMQCGSADWAVRCFLNNIQDQQQRYAELSKFVMSDKLDCTVGFHYIEQGIKVRGTWYPILKMEWVEGETLGEFVEQHVHDFESMRNLALQFEMMMTCLKEAGVAHGDLQHGNIIVSETSPRKDGRSDLALRLVDYDGMFVPALRGWQSNELGHRNYQHPARNATHFDPSLDNFSAWLIYCSLICLAIDPLLWDELDGGDECLLFRQDDFRDVGNSRAFSIMLYHQSPVVRECADWLARLSEMPPDKVPYLSDEPSRAQSITFKQRARRALDVRKIVSKVNRKPGEVGPEFVEAVSQSVNGAPVHSYKHAIGPRTKRVRAAGTALLVTVVLLYLVNIFGQAVLNRQNSTMFPKTKASKAVAVPDLPARFTVNEDGGRTSVWTFSPTSNDLLQRYAKRYTIAPTGGGGGTGEVYIESPKTEPGSLVANRRDLTGEHKGSQVHYEGRWDGSEFSGVANYKAGGQTHTYTFRAIPKLPESSWLKPKTEGAPRDEFKR